MYSIILASLAASMVPLASADFTLAWYSATPDSGCSGGVSAPSEGCSGYAMVPIDKFDCSDLQSTNAQSLGGCFASPATISTWTVYASLCDAPSNDEYTFTWENGNDDVVSYTSKSGANSGTCNRNTDQGTLCDSDPCYPMVWTKAYDCLGALCGSEGE